MVTYLLTYLLILVYLISFIMFCWRLYCQVSWFLKSCQSSAVFHSYFTAGRATFEAGRQPTKFNAHPDVLIRLGLFTLSLSTYSIFYNTV